MKIYMHFGVHLELNLRFRVKKFGMNIIEKNKTIYAKYTLPITFLVLIDYSREGTSKHTNKCALFKE
jgi:hypothetical protein